MYFYLTDLVLKINCNSTSLTYNINSSCYKPGEMHRFTNINQQQKQQPPNELLNLWIIRYLGETLVLLFSVLHFTEVCVIYAHTMLCCYVVDRAELCKRDFHQPTTEQSNEPNRTLWHRIYALRLVVVWLGVHCVFLAENNRGKHVYRAHTHMNGYMQYICCCCCSNDARDAHTQSLGSRTRTTNNIYTVHNSHTYIIRIRARCARRVKPSLRV